ncbi:hypothetical protein MKW98_031140 [Papaver atlanticum]|uniref:Uncharacterized protein n=1 Tax=Papaver atlanticum TaxID=357466 RepID=A0AAD4SWX4_9MAGN|nr:hypothetical protein MKW98_031140 [Papaver atlanticum]
MMYYRKQLCPRAIWKGFSDMEATLSAKEAFETQDFELHEAPRVADVVETLKEGRVHTDYSNLVKADDNGKDKVV